MSCVGTFALILHLFLHTDDVQWYWNEILSGSTITDILPHLLKCSKFESHDNDVTHSMSVLPQMQANTLSRWETIDRACIGDYRIFELDTVHRRNPRNGEGGAFTVLRTPLWVNVIPVTSQGQAVMVRQYRHGTDSITLEFPGGVVQPGEMPVTAAMRECLEETGYGADPSTIELVGIQLPNPAFLETQCYTFVWHNCQPCQQPRWDEHELLEILEIPLEQIDSLIANASIQHSIIIAAWTLWKLRNTSIFSVAGGFDGKSHNDC